MTPETLEYLLRVTIIWLALLAYYFAVGRKTDFRFQRFFLLGGWLFGLAVPLLPALGSETVLPVMNLPNIAFQAPVFVAEGGEAAMEASWRFADFLPWLYFLGAAFFAARTLVQWWFMEQCLRSGQRSRFNGYPVIRSLKVNSPFAARGYVFLPMKMTDAGLENTALIHESSHLRARHHYDKFLLTLGSIVLWFHPLTWAYRRLLATVHEYEADAAVLQQVPARTYGLQLLHCSLGPARGLGLFSSPLKQRIEMIINKTTERKLRFIPLLGLCLLLLGLTVACSDLAEDVAVPLNSENPFDQMEVDPFEHMEDPVVNHTPPYYGESEDPAVSRKALLRAIDENIKYPVEARSSGTTGKFYALLFFSDKGELTNLEVSEIKPEQSFTGEEIVVVGYGSSEKKRESQPEILQAEIERTLRSLDQFSPGTKYGRAVAAAMGVNIKFKLEE